MAKTQLSSGSSSTRSRKSQQSNLPKAPDDIWSKLEELNRGFRGERPGPEWFTTIEYATKFNMTKWAARYRLLALVKKGSLEMRVKPQYFKVKVGPRKE